MSLDALSTPSEPSRGRARERAPASSTLYGRRRERDALARLLAEARGGRGRLALVSGEAGIGKTELVNDLARTAAELGCLVLSGRCYDLSTTPPYGPWLEIVRASPRVEGLSSLSAVIEGETSGDESAARRPADILAWAMELIAALAAQQPLVAILDDLHWSDEASLDGLRRVGREIAALPVLLIATYRDDELTRRHPLFELIPLLVREAQAERIALRPLDERELHEWVASRYDLEAHDRQRLVEHLARYSDGIPLFVGELLRSLEEERVITEAGGRFAMGTLVSAAVPLLLRQILDRRVSRATPSTRELLAIAAVIGQHVSYELWERVSEAGQAELEQAADEAVERGLLIGDPRQPGLAFRHALIRELLYQDVLPHRRQIWHRRVAERLLETEAPDPDEVAHHLRMAGDPRAIEWLIRAGERAHRGAYAFQTAARRYEAALELAGTRNELLPTRGWLLARLASVLRYSDPGQSVVLLNDALDIATRLGDDALAGMAVWMRGTMRIMAGENGLADAITGDAMLSELDESELRRIGQKFGGRLPDAVARRGGLAWWHGYHGRPADALEHAEWVEAHIDESGRADIDRATARTGRAFAHSLSGRLDAARADYREARRLFEERGYAFHVTTLTAFEFYLLDLPYFTTDLRERKRKHELLMEFASQGLRELVRLPAEFAVSGHLLIEGHWDRLASLFDSMRDAPRSYFSWNYAVPALATYARHTGDAEMAADLARLLVPEGPRTDVGNAGVPLRSLEMLRLGADLALDAGDLEAAREWIAAHDRWLAWSTYLLGQPEGAMLWSRYHRLSGDDAAAREAAERALDLASRPAQPLAQAAARRALAELDVSEGCLDAARAHIDAALDLADACAAPFERALGLLVGGRLDLAAGRPDDAACRLEEAVRICERLGARPALEEATRLLADARSRPASELLSARELEVLALVAEGHTDREVADRLFISPRTVNQHLRSIYNKLGINTRAAATRRGIELGLL